MIKMIIVVRHQKAVEGCHARRLVDRHEAADVVQTASSCFWRQTVGDPPLRPRSYFTRSQRPTSPKEIAITTSLNSGVIPAITWDKGSPTGTPCAPV